MDCDGRHARATLTTVPRMPDVWKYFSEGRLHGDTTSSAGMPGKGCEGEGRGRRRRKRDVGGARDGRAPGRVVAPLALQALTSASDALPPPYNTLACLPEPSTRDGHQLTLLASHSCPPDADQEPRLTLRLPDTVHAVGPLYEPPAALHTLAEHNVLSDMHDLNPRLQPRSSVHSPGDCGESCLTVRSTHRNAHLSPLPTNEDLLPFIRDRHNLILDSIDPSLAPHIVITPPDFPYDGYWAFVQNGVGPQLEANALSVPPVVSGRSVLWPPWQDRHYVWHAAQYPRAASAHRSKLSSSFSSSHDNEIRTPRAVFNLARFELAILAAEQERLVMYHVIPSLHRIHYKAAVILASTVAFDFRRRWDRPEFRNSVEKPFHWTDEAEPLLALLSRDPSSLILDSVYPCTVPHIVITEAPQQDPWEAVVNNTPTPQDCGFGYYLTVPCSLVDFVNTALPEHAYDEADFWSAVSVSDDEDSRCESAVSEISVGPFSESESGSDDESPTPLTPPNGILELNSVELVVSDATCLRPTAKTTNFYIYENEDDEDDLPPFDDWYLDIAQRATLAC